MQQEVRAMFAHAWDAYLLHAFPGDELKPLSQTATNSLGELGNLDLQHLTDGYRGVALTAIDALSTLAIMGNWTEFERMTYWIADNVSFDQDVRVNVFEANIRVLGGMLSAHLLAEQATGWGTLTRTYQGELLDVAYEFGQRLLPAFNASPTGLPYAWVNLKTGVRPEEVTESNTAACGTLLLEFGVLSRLTGDARFELAARRALRTLWSMRTPRGLFGSSLDVVSGTWVHDIGGIGPGADSFYEYLFKSYVLFDDPELWDMFTEAYVAALQHYRFHDYYTDASIYTGKPVHLQFQSLQAFWPGLQAQIGDVQLGTHTFWNFFRLWEAYGVLPERWLLTERAVHWTEHYYPLRPELMESAFHLHQATGVDPLRAAGRAMVEGLQRHARVPEGGFANIRNVQGHVQEDHMSSYFLAETLAYLYLLFDDTFVKRNPYVFSTEGHPFPVTERLQTPVAADWPLTCAPNSTRSCPMVFAVAGSDGGRWGWGDQVLEGAGMGVGSLRPAGMAGRQCPVLGTTPGLCYEVDRYPTHTCGSDLDCGREAVNCVRRTCSAHGFCQTRSGS